VVSNGAGSTYSQEATLTVGGVPPLVASRTLPSTLLSLFGSSLTLSVQATNEPGCLFPIIYSWLYTNLNGYLLYAPNVTNYTIEWASVTNAGVYSVVIS